MRYPSNRPTTKLVFYFEAVVALLTGLASVLAFSPYHMPLLAIVCPMILLRLCIYQRQSRHVFLYVFVYQLAFFGLGMHWIFISIHRFAGGGILQSTAITVLFVLLESLFLPLLLACLHRCTVNKHNLFLCGFPVMWVAAELLRASMPLGGLPWLQLGYAQTSTWLSAFAPWAGVIGVTFFVLILAVLLFLVIEIKRWQTRLLLVLIVACITYAAFLLRQLRFTYPAGKPLRVALLQGNVPQSLKWQSSSLQHTLRRYQLLTQINMDADLVVWPEAAIPTYPSNIPDTIQTLQTLATHNHQNILAGAPLYRPGQYFNGALLITPRRANQQYHKIHLVPFGEYYPWQWLVGPVFKGLHIDMSSYTAGERTQPPLTLQMDGRAIPLATYICYEIAYTNLVLHNAHHTALLVTISDDTWFGDSIARPQHLQMAQMQSIITQRYQLFVGNDGITAVIQPNGQIAKQLPINIKATLRGTVTPLQGDTPLMRLYQWFRKT